MNSIILSKYLFDKARSVYSPADHLSMGISVSLLQDSAEMLLWHIVKTLKLQIARNEGFASVIEKVDKEHGVDFKPDIIELNNSRVNFKHSGNLPSLVDMEKFITGTHAFLKANAHKIGVSFDAISMADLINNEQVKTRIKNSELKLQAEEYEAALIETSIAFGELESDAKAKIRERHFDVDKIRDAYHIWPKDSWDEARNFTNLLQEIIDDLVTSTALSNLGYSPDYILAIKKKGFNVNVSMTGNIIGVHSTGHSDPSKENIMTMNSLIIELAMRLY